MWTVFSRRFEGHGQTTPNVVYCLAQRLNHALHFSVLAARPNNDGHVGTPPISPKPAMIAIKGCFEDTFIGRHAAPLFIADGLPAAIAMRVEVDDTALRNQLNSARSPACMTSLISVPCPGVSTTCISSRQLSAAGKGIGAG